MKILYLVRHGQTDATKNKLWIGARSLYKLNDEGRKEAASSGSALRDLNLDSTSIYSSPVERCFQTAKIIQQKLDLPIIPIPDLSEVFFGDLDGIDEESFKNEYGRYYAEWSRSTLDFYPPNGESGRRFVTRAITVINELTLESETKETIIVTHSGIIKSFLAHILNIDLNTAWRDLPTPDAPTGSLTKILYHDGKFEYVETIGGGIDG